MATTTVQRAELRIASNVSGESKADDGLCASALEGVRDLAYEVQGAAELIANEFADSKEVAHG